jgi:hypothetical protein
MVAAQPPGRHGQIGEKIMNDKVKFWLLLLLLILSVALALWLNSSYNQVLLS